MKIERGTIIYVFQHQEDPWVDELRRYFIDVLGWCHAEWTTAWIYVETRMPSLFGQLMTVYRYMKLSPQEAITELVRHPDYRYLKEVWEDFLILQERENFLAKERNRNR